MAPGLQMQNFQFMNGMYGMNNCCSVGSWYGNNGFQDGALLATSLFSIAGMAVMAYQNRQPKADPLGDKQAEINQALEKMPEGFNTEATYNNQNFEELEEGMKVQVQKLKIEKFDKEIKGYTDSLATYDQSLADIDRQIKEATDKKKPTSDLNAKKAKIQAERQEVESKKQKAEADKAKAEEELKTLQTAFDNKVAEIKTKQEAISKLISEKTNLEKTKQQQADYDALNKGDGNIAQRNFFTKEFKQSSKAQCRSAIYDFRKALVAFEKDTTNAQNKANLKQAYKNLQAKYTEYQNGLGQKTADTSLTTSMGIADKKAIEYGLNAAD